MMQSILSNCVWFDISPQSRGTWPPCKVRNKRELVLKVFTVCLIVGVVFILSFNIV